MTRVIFPEQDLTRIQNSGFKCALRRVSSPESSGYLFMGNLCRSRAVFCADKELRAQCRSVPRTWTVCFEFRNEHVHFLNETT